MSKQKVYLDTSVISAMLDTRTPERMALTREAWAKFDTLEVWVSDLVIEELSAAKQPRRSELLALVDGFHRASVSESALELARFYVSNGIFPDAYFDDALHVAIASEHGIPYLLSWNYKHMVKVKTRRLVALTNALRDYHAVEIIAPPEL